MPLASVIIPTYNYGHYICQAIDSIFNQDFFSNEIEIIVVDDGSTDDTKEVLRDFIESKKIKYFFQPNKGKANATNFAINECSGRYIFNLDADDYFLPDKISKSIDIFESDDSIVHVASPAQVYYQETKTSGIENLPEDILEKPIDGNWLLRRFYNSNILFGGGTTYAAKSSILKKIGIPDEVDMYIDEFLILAILPFGKSFFVRQPLSVWRVHKSNYSGSNLDGEMRLKKGKRLINSSAAVLAYLNQHQFDKELIKIYKLQDATRRIAFYEDNNNKKALHIIRYASEVFLRIKPTWHLIKKYNVINRLIPSSIFRFLKKVNNSNKVSN